MQSDFTTKLLAHYRDLLRFLSRELRNADDVADIAQTSFERVYGYAAHPESPLKAADIESPRALLFRVARNLCIDEARHRKISRTWAAQHVAENNIAPSEEYLFAQRQLLLRVMDTLAALPARRRDAFLLFRAYGYSQKEIAEKLNITEATVTKHILRATMDCALVFAELRLQLPQAAFAFSVATPAPLPGMDAMDDCYG